MEFSGWAPARRNQRAFTRRYARTNPSSERRPVRCNDGLGRPPVRSGVATRCRGARPGGAGAKAHAVTVGRRIGSALRNGEVSRAPKWRVAASTPRWRLSREEGDWAADALFGFGRDAPLAGLTRMPAEPWQDSRRCPAWIPRHLLRFAIMRERSAPSDDPCAGASR